MKLPFSQEQFLDVFARYNHGIWPVQILAFAVCLLLVGAMFLRKTPSHSAVMVSLGLLWLLNGIGYHWMYFAHINPAARVFGAAFVLQAILFFIAAKPRNQCHMLSGPRAYAGWAMLTYAVVVYPLIGAWAGHTYPRSPILGVAPCPTTIYTLGLLLAFVGRTPRHLFVIPLLWSGLSLSAAVSLGIWEDFGLGLSGLVSLAFLVLPGLDKPARATVGAAPV